MNWTVPNRGHFYSNRKYLISMKHLNQKRQRKERKLVASAPVNFVWMSNLILNEKKIWLPPSNILYFHIITSCMLVTRCDPFLMHLDKNTKRIFLGKAGHNFFATTHVISYLVCLILFPAWRKHSVALQTASVAADDRLMKRVQSRPAGWFCTCSKKYTVMSGWFQRAGAHRNARSIIYGHTEMGGEDPGGARVTYSTYVRM